MLDCYGKGKVKKFAEIVAATVLAGEISLMTAVEVDTLARTSEWVDSHETYGRNRGP